MPQMSKYMLQRSISYEDLEQDIRYNQAQREENAKDDLESYDEDIDWQPSDTKMSEEDIHDDE